MTDYILILRQLMEKYYKYNKAAILYNKNILFVDFKQAYDSIKRKQLWITLKNFGIPNKLVRLIQKCNEQTN